MQPRIYLSPLIRAPVQTHVLKPTPLRQTPKSQYSTTRSPSSKPPSTSQWLSLTKQRIGKAIMFGLARPQATRAADMLKILGEEWRELVAGREGFLTGKKRAGLVRQRVVWGEMDCMNHINNVAYTRYAESARINWAYNFAVHIDPTHKREWSELWTPRGDGLILRSIKVDYKFPMTYPDAISVYHKLSSPPSQSSPANAFQLDVLIISERHQRIAARCTEDIVVYDYVKGQKVEMRPFMRDAFERLWDEQEGESERVGRRVAEVEEMVNKLEKELEGAKEDFGSGS